MAPYILKATSLIILGMTFVLVVMPQGVTSRIRVARQNNGGVTTTTRKPPTLATPAQPGAGLTTEQPMLVETVTQVPYSEKPGFSYLTQHLSSAYYISDGTGTKNEAVLGCQGIDDGSKSFDLAGLEEGEELHKVVAAMQAAGIKEAYINVVTDNLNGTNVQIRTGLYGTQIKPVDDANSRKKRSVLVSYAHRRVQRDNRQMTTHRTTVKPGLGHASAGDGVGHFISIQDTQFPWIGNWGNTKPGCLDTSKCKPTICTVDTPSCEATTNDCVVESEGTCTVLPSGNCSMVCENCEIQKPTCYVKEPKCTVIKDRVCTVVSTHCEINTPDCTVSRPECVSHQPPCNITPNTSPNCTTPELCLTEQAMTCETKLLACTDAERKRDPSKCEYQECEAYAVCIKPDYCRREQVICPPIETFCPPEIVKCPPPTVVCPEPKVECTEPQIYCPPPTVVCTKPLVNCSAPTVNCPNVVTRCPNPELNCPPPTVNCPPPSVICIPPENPCPIHPLPSRPCLFECTGECNCVKLVVDGNGNFKEEKCKCDNKLSYICEGAVNKGVNVAQATSKTTKRPATTQRVTRRTTKGRPTQATKDIRPAGK